jgi:hypothetical protein
MDDSLPDHQSCNQGRIPKRNDLVNRRDARGRSTMAAILLGAALLCAALACSSAAADAATARTAFDGSWNIVFVTRAGNCDPAYDFTVNVTNGIVTHPNLVRFRGEVAPSGSVRASVAVQDKYASGSGRLSRMSGRGRWSGRSGNSLCSGYWTAQRN